MELIVDKENGNKVYLFEESLGEQVWEPEPITRFRNAYKLGYEKNI